MGLCGCYGTKNRILVELSNVGIMKYYVSVSFDVILMMSVVLVRGKGSAVLLGGVLCKKSCS